MNTQQRLDNGEKLGDIYYEAKVECDDSFSELVGKNSKSMRDRINQDYVHEQLINYRGENGTFRGLILEGIGNRTMQFLDKLFETKRKLIGLPEYACPENITYGERFYGDEGYEKIARMTATHHQSLGHEYQDNGKSLIGVLGLEEIPTKALKDVERYIAERAEERKWKNTLSS